MPGKLSFLENHNEIRLILENNDVNIILNRNLNKGYFNTLNTAKF